MILYQPQMGVKMNTKKKKLKIVDWLPKILFFIFIIVLWQTLYTQKIFPTLTFPSIQDIGKAFVKSFRDDSMAAILGRSLWLIAKGLIVGIILAFICSALSICFKSFYSVYSMVVSVFDPLPGVALLPLAILWFGTGEATIIFLIIHSVIWPMSRNIIDGFNSTPKLLVESGKNIGLTRFSIVTGVYLPASTPYILSGLRVGWARAWRALISAEMIFGATNSGGGIGYYLFIKRYQLETATVYASLVIIIILGLIIEYGLFANLEKRTIKKWGMVR